jgi:hypothetical protein
MPRLSKIALMRQARRYDGYVPMTRTGQSFLRLHPCSQRAWRNHHRHRPHSSLSCSALRALADEAGGHRGQASPFARAGDRHHQVLAAFVLARPCPRHALARGYQRSQAVNHGSSGSPLTWPFGVRAGAAVPLGSAFQAGDATIDDCRVYGQGSPLGQAPQRPPIRTARRFSRQGDGRRCLAPFAARPGSPPRSAAPSSTPSGTHRCPPRSQECSRP